MEGELRFSHRNKEMSCCSFVLPGVELPLSKDILHTVSVPFACPIPGMLALHLFSFLVS